MIKKSTLQECLVTAAEAHSNLNLWAAVEALLENHLLYGNSSKHAAADRVIRTAKREQQKFLAEYDKARAMAEKA